MVEIKKMSTPALAAKMIRAELKKAYPNKKFRVTSESYAGGSAVNVTNLNGFANAEEQQEMDKILQKYEYGKFNGMEDIYEYTNVREDLPQVSYASLYNGESGVMGGYGKYGTDFTDSDDISQYLPTPELLETLKESNA